MLNHDLTARVSRETTLAPDEAVRLVDTALAQGLTNQDAYTVVMAAYTRAAAGGYHPSVNTVRGIADLVASKENNLLDYFAQRPDLNQHERSVIVGALVDIVKPAIERFVDAFYEVQQQIIDAFAAVAEQVRRFDEQFAEMVNPDHNEEDEVPE